MKVDFLSAADKKELIRKLEETYGIKELPFLLFRIGRDKIRAYSGMFSREELMEIGRHVNVEILGIYLFKIENDGVRISHDALSILKNQIIKNIIELNSEQANEWLKGSDLQIKAQKSFVVIKHNALILGCGKSTGEKITNFVPKERRIKG